MSKRLTYNNRSSLGLFLINKITRSILPPLEIPSVRIPKRAGAIGLETEIGIREIVVDITMVADTDAQLKARVKELASWFYQTVDRQLEFSDDPTVFINARLSGATDFNEIARLGEGRLVFICHDPFYYSKTEISLLVGSPANERIFLNLGTFRTFPTLRILPHGAPTNVRITNHRNNQHILLNTTVNWQLLISEHANNTIYQDSNKQRMFNHLDITSDFFPLEVGENRITVSNTQNITTDVRLVYRERFL
jgi:predicted phage tail component-like protein